MFRLLNIRTIDRQPIAINYAIGARSGAAAKKISTLVRYSVATEGKGHVHLSATVSMTLSFVLRDCAVWML